MMRLLIHNCLFNQTAQGANQTELIIPASMSAKLPPHTEAIEDEPEDTEQRQSMSSGHILMRRLRGARDVPHRWTPAPQT